MALFANPPLRNFPDHAIRELLKDLVNLEELLTAAAPQQAACLDCRQAVLLDRGFILEDWRERESDLLFRIPLRTPESDRAALVCLLLEHQSAADPVMPLRLLVGAAQFWEREWKAWESRHDFHQPLRLSPIIPVVFHTGLSPWRSNRSLSELIAAPQLFEPFTPQWPPLFFDLAERQPQELLDASSRLLQAFAVVRAEKENTDSFVTIFQEVMQRLTPLYEQAPVRWHDLMWFVISWAILRRPPKERPLLQTVIQESQPEPAIRREMVTMGQITEKSWQEECLEQLAEREVHTQLRAYRDILRSLLSQRFDSLPDALLRQIEATADLKRLEAAIAQAWQIAKLEDLKL